MSSPEKPKRKPSRWPVLIAIAKREADRRWGSTVAMVRETRRFHGGLCEVGVADPSSTLEPWRRPMIVLGAGWSWKRAFADADARARAQQATDAGASDPAPIAIVERTKPE